jgi:hypothetical protein
VVTVRILNNSEIPQCIIGFAWYSRNKSFICKNTAHCLLHSVLIFFLNQGIVYSLSTPNFYNVVVSSVADRGCLSRIQQIKEQGKNKLVVLPFLVANYLFY